MITDEEKMQIERARVSDLLAVAIQTLAAENGDIRFFNAAFLVAAIQLHAEVEGPEGRLPYHCIADATRYMRNALSKAR